VRQAGDVHKCWSAGSFIDFLANTVNMLSIISQHSLLMSHLWSLFRNRNIYFAPRELVMVRCLDSPIPSR